MRLDPYEEGMRWLLQATQDLDDANYNLKGKRYHLACFLSQQAGEKALKAFLYSKGEEMVLGHSVARLLKSAIGHDLDPEAIKGTAGLDKYYIPTRYPNGLPGGVPYEAFDEGDALKAIGLASRIVDHVGAIFKEQPEAKDRI
jgi:HEPN domain-containing protein